MVEFAKCASVKVGGRWLAGGKRSSRLSFTLAKLVRPLIKGALQTELGLGQVGGQLGKEEEHYTEWYFGQVSVNFGSNVRESVEKNC